MRVLYQFRMIVKRSTSIYVYESWKKNLTSPFVVMFGVLPPRHNYSACLSELLFALSLALQIRIRIFILNATNSQRLRRNAEDEKIELGPDCIFAIIPITLNCRMMHSRMTTFMLKRRLKYNSRDLRKEVDA